MTNNKNNVTNNTNIQSLQFENGKHIFSIFYVPGMFAGTSWALYKDNIYKPFKHNIKEVVKKAEDNGWIVFNYSDLPDSWFWKSNSNSFYKDIIKGHLDDILTICNKGGVDVNHQVECITLLLENWEEK